MPAIKYTYTYFFYAHMYTYQFLYSSSIAQGGGGSFKSTKPKIGCCEAWMAGQKHWWIALSNCLADKLPNCLIHD